MRAWVADASRFGTLSQPGTANSVPRQTRHPREEAVSKHMGGMKNK